MIEELVKLADELDSLGYHKEASQIDEYIKKVYNKSSSYTYSYEDLIEKEKLFSGD